MTAGSRTPPAFLPRSITVDGQEHRYAIFTPHNQAPASPTPLILYLHGKGECGTDGLKQLTVGLPAAVAKSPERWPFVILIPQKPEAQKQWEHYEPALLAMLDATESEFKIDPARRYLTGLSQGGHATWVLGSRQAARWAALAPICAYADPRPIAAGLTEMPIWAFHGLKDLVVPAAQTRQLVAAVRALAAERNAGDSRIRETLYPDLDHNSWDRAYQDEPLPEWFLAHRKSP